MPGQTRIFKRAKKRTLTPKKWFVWLVKPNILSFLRRRYNITVIHNEEVKDLEPPFIMVGNHVNFWDPFFLHMDISPTIQYIASDNVFRTKVLGTVMRLLGSIPTSKFRSDLATIAQVLRIVKRRGVVGVFPEGRRTWDGQTLWHVPTVSKLIHKLKLPVIGVIIKGGYLSSPRWARHIRRGKIELEYKLVFTPEELASISAEECHALLEERIYHDDMEWQRERMIPFAGKSLAEYIESTLFACPKCKDLASIHSSGDTGECKTCGYSFRHNQYGFLEAINGPLVFNTVHDWNEWQVEYLKEYLYSQNDPEKVLLEDGPAILLRGYRTRPLKRINTGRAYLTLQGVEFHTTIGKRFFFPIEEIMGENVQMGEKFEFYHQTTLFRLDFINPRVSSYKWYQAVFLLHQKLQENRQELDNQVNA